MTHWRSLLTCLLCLFFVLPIQVSRVTAQAVDPSDKVHDIAKRLNCPTCAGRNLADCPTDTCMQWKQEIRSQLETGKTDDQVIAYFYDRFGSVVLQEPPREGLLLLVWILPIFGLVALGTGAVFLLYKLRRVPQLTPNVTESTPVDDEYARRLEEEIQA